jgi:hypothetical protein
VSDDYERHLFTRVLDALLREDHLGLLSDGRAHGPDWWEVPHAAGLLRIPVRADGFQQALRSAAPMVQVVMNGTARRSARHGPNPAAASCAPRPPGGTAPPTRCGASDWPGTSGTVPPAVAGVPRCCRSSVGARRSPPVGDGG